MIPIPTFLLQTLHWTIIILFPPVISLNIKWQTLHCNYNPVSPVISLNIKCSKIDVDKASCQNALGRTGDDLCPVTALLTYLSQQGDKPGALFQWNDGTPLAKSKFVEAVRQALSAALLPVQDYAGHS